MAAAMLVGISTSVAEAQRGWGMGPHMQGEWGSWGGWWAGGDVIDRVDGRLAYIKAELKITEEQTAAWRAFADAMRASAETHNEMMQSMHADNDAYWEKPLPERLELHVALMESRLAQLKSMKEVGDQLYSALSDDQKKIADEIVMPMMGAGPGPMGRWRQSDD
jgi:hypothetical protein